MPDCPQLDRDRNGRMNAAEIVAAMRDRTRGCEEFGSRTPE
jgi:hypothetical protein